MLFSLYLSFTCESRCPYVQNSSGICANDGHVYASLCHAKCKNYSAYIKFQCPYGGYTNCRQRCLTSGTVSPGSVTTIDIQVTTPSSMDICQRRCLLTNSYSYFCGSDGKVYQNACQARCHGSHIRHVFMCQLPLNLTNCRNTCHRIIHNPYPPVTIPQPSPVPSPVIVPRPCDDEGLVCASNGSVYYGNCSTDFNNNNVRVVFNCDENGLKRESACQQVCSSFFNNPCVTHCQSSSNQNKCYSNGKVMKNQCLARCMGVYELFTCGFRRRRCKRRCRNNGHFNLGQFRLGSSRP